MTMIAKNKDLEDERPARAEHLGELSPAQLHARGLAHLADAALFASEGDSQAGAELAAVAQAFFFAALSAGNLAPRPAAGPNEFTGHHG